MFLINRFGFYASYPAAFCNLADPICLFLVGCFCIYPPFPSSGQTSPGCWGDKRKKKSQPRKGDDTSAENSVQSDKDYIRGMCKNRGRCQICCSESGKISQGNWFCALRRALNKRRAGYFVENVIQWKLPSVHKGRKE